MYAIPITPFTLDLIQELNGGIRPTMEREPTMFIFRPNGVASQIITRSQFENMSADQTFVTICYFT